MRPPTSSRKYATPHADGADGNSRYRKDLKITKCPFVNLPEKSEGRWGQGLTAEKMKQCTWVRPNVVVRIDFLEWTGADHLRHTKFVALRDDKDPRKVVKEEPH